MTSRHEVREGESSRTPRGPGWRVAGWVLGIVGGISAFLGLFILFAGEDQYVGIGGDLSWRVGDISSAWMYGLLIGGGLALLMALGMIAFSGARVEPAQGDSADLAELIWHAGIFTVVNAFIWVQDIAIGGGVEYAYWVTIPWGIGLGIHASLHYWSRRQSSHQGHPRDLQPHH